MFSFIKNRLVKFGEIRTIPAYTTFEGNFCFVKFNQFIANWLFVNQERANHFENWIQCSGRKSPSHLVSIVEVFTPIDKVELTTKTFYKPFEARRFGIVALQLDFVSRIRAICGRVFLNAKTAFSINKSSKIGKIIIGGRNGVSKFLQRFFYGNWNKIRFFEFFHSDKIDFSVNTRFTPEKISKKKTLFSFFNQKPCNIQKPIKIIAFQFISIEWFMSGINFFLGINIPRKLGLKPFQIFKFSRINNYRAGISNSLCTFNSID